MKHISFDIETATQIPDGDNEYKCAGISCAATYLSDTCERQAYSSKFKNAEGMRHDRMTIGECRALATTLSINVGLGYDLVTWNGNFDLKVLANECHDAGLYATCQELARNMYDPMFTFLCKYGFPVGLEKVSTAMGLGEKAGMHGKDAPILWRVSPEKQDDVLQYVKGDSLLTSQVFEMIERTGQVAWVTRAGAVKSRPLELRTLTQSLELPKPSLSWFEGEIPAFFRREHHTRWLDETV